MRLPAKSWMGIAAATALLFAGCGDDDGGGSDISQEEFIGQANAICEEGEEEINEIFAGLSEDTGEEEVADLLVDEFIPNIRSQIDEIRDLGLPEGDEDELNGIFSDAEAVLDDIEANPEAFVTADDDPFGDVNQRLTDYGLSACGD